MKKDFEQFQTSQAAILIRDNKCLIVEFTSHPGEWGLPGGRVDRGEYCEESFRRELKEELNFDRFDIIGIVDFDIWYYKDVSKAAIAFLIENEDDEIKIDSEEHINMKWVSESEADSVNFIWPNAARMIKKGFKYKRLLENYEK